jgi:hypothetical protein
VILRQHSKKKRFAKKKGQEQMSSSYEDFVEVLENDDEVDVAKLADMAQHGVPAEVRGSVWKYLLGAAHADKCDLIDLE